MIHRLEITTRRGLRDARGEHIARKIRTFLDIPVTAVRTRDVYHLEADLTESDVADVVHEFADPVLHDCAVGKVDDASSASRSRD